MADLGPVEVQTNVIWRNQFGRFAKAIDTGGDAATREAAQRGAMLAAVFAPKETLELAGSIEPVFYGRGSGGWIAGSGHALPQEHGARPHEIRPTKPHGKLVNRKKHFYSAGPVHHPGNPATHFMRRALDQVQRDMMRIVKKVMPG